MSENQTLLETRAWEITQKIYVAFGSEYCVLFGIPSYYRKAVQTIVKITLEMAGEKEVEE